MQRANYASIMFRSLIIRVSKTVQWETLEIFPEFAKGLSNFSNGHYSVAALEFKRVSETMNQFAKDSVEANMATFFYLSTLFKCGHVDATALSILSKSKFASSDHFQYIDSLHALYTLKDQKSIVNARMQALNILKDDNLQVAYDCFHSSNIEKTLAFLKNLETFALPVIPTTPITAEEHIHASNVYSQYINKSLAVCISVEATVDSLLKKIDYGSPKRAMSAKVAMQNSMKGSNADQNATSTFGFSDELKSEIDSVESILKLALKICQDVGVKSAQTPVEAFIQADTAYLISHLARIVSARLADPIVVEGLTRRCLSTWDSVKTTTEGKNLLSLHREQVRHAMCLKTHADLLGYWEDRESEASQVRKEADSILSSEENVKEWLGGIPAVGMGKVLD